MLVDGKQEEGTVGRTVGPGNVQTIAAWLKCNGIGPGPHAVALQARSLNSEVLVDNAADDGLHPIVVPPGDQGPPSGDGSAPARGAEPIRATTG